MCIKGTKITLAGQPYVFVFVPLLYSCNLFVSKRLLHDTELLRTSPFTSHPLSLSKQADELMHRFLEYCNAQFDTCELLQHEAGELPQMKQNLEELTQSAGDDTQR